MPGGSIWNKWEQLRKSPDPDPIEVLKAVAAFQRYFATIEKEAIRVARAQDRTWQEIGTALGKTRQALWQRADSRGDEADTDHWEAIRRTLEDSWAQSAEVRHNVGLAPP